jgi:hypothetical protein
MAAISTAGQLRATVVCAAGVGATLDSFAADYRRKLAVIKDFNLVEVRVEEVFSAGHQSA